MEYVPTKISEINETIILFSTCASRARTIAIAVERIFAIRFPTKYHVFNTFKTKLIKLLLAWIIPVAFVVSL